jgi:hypothetical protein
MSFASWPNDIHLSFPVIFLTKNSSLSKRNMKPAWISDKEGLYRSEDPLNQQHMTCQFFMEAKRKFQKKVGIKMPFILRLKRVIELLEMVDMLVNQAR